MALPVAVAVTILDVGLFSRLLELSSNDSWTLLAATPPLIVAAGAIELPLLLLLRRTSPVAASLALSAYSAVLVLTIGSRPTIGPLLVLYLAASQPSRARATLCGLAGVAAHTLYAAYEYTAVTGTVFTALIVLLVYALFDAAAWGLGRTAAAAAARNRVLEETRTALAAEAVEAERRHIARELHDIVSHAVTLMVIQAAVAQRAIEHNPTAALTAMDTVRNSGSQAMAELGRLLTVLRTVEDANSAGPRSVAGLAHLDQLTNDVEATGVSITTTMTGTSTSLDPSVDLAAYRVIQESLTNITRHVGSGAHVEITLCWTTDTITITVADDGIGIPDSAVNDISSGFGFIGMQERIRLLGGTVTISPTTPTGHLVTATLPTRAIPPIDSSGVIRDKFGNRLGTIK